MLRGQQHLKKAAASTVSTQVPATQLSQSSKHPLTPFERSTQREPSGFEYVLLQGGRGRSRGNNAERSRTHGKGSGLSSIG